MLTALALWIITSNAIDIIGQDMNVVFTVQQILLGHPIYQDPAAPPYAITQYTPLYYYVAALPAKIANVSAGDVLAVSAISRGVSFVIACALAWVCALFLRRRVGATGSVTLVAVVFIMLGTANWYFAVRPDGLATLLTISSFYLITSEMLTRRVLGAVALTAIAAILAKQSGMIVTGVIVAFLAMRQQWPQLRTFAVMFILVSIAGAVALMSAGPAVYANVVDGVNNGIAWRSALMMAYRPTYYWFAPLFALVFAALPQLLRRNASPVENLLGVAIPLSLAFGLVTALKRGSAENYFNELVILSVFAFITVYVRRASEPLIVSALNVYLVAFLLIRAGHQVYTTYLYHRISPETRLTSQIPPVDYVRRQIDPQRYAMGFAVGLSNAFPERMIIPEKDLADAAQRRALVDYSRFKRDMESGRIEFAVIPNGERLKPFLHASLDRFRPVRRFKYYTVYRLE
jgi:hypothetical protein